MIEAGINGFNPCEVHGGMDVGRIRDAYPKLYLDGGNAKKALTLDEVEIKEEMAKRFRVAWEGERYRPSIDHGALPYIPWRNLLVFARYNNEWSHTQPIG